MQKYLCYICRQDSLEGGSLVHEGMFFKLCKDCLEDEENVKLLNETMMALDIDENDESAKFENSNIIP